MRKSLILLMLIITSTTLYSFDLELKEVFDISEYNIELPSKVIFSGNKIFLLCFQDKKIIESNLGFTNFKEKYSSKDYIHSFFINDNVIFTAEGAFDWQRLNSDSSNDVVLDLLNKSFNDKIQIIGNINRSSNDKFFYTEISWPEARICSFSISDMKKEVILNEHEKTFIVDVIQNDRLILAKGNIENKYYLLNLDNDEIKEIEVAVNNSFPMIYYLSDYEFIFLNDTFEYEYINTVDKVNKKLGIKDHIIFLNREVEPNLLYNFKSKDKYKIKEIEIYKIFRS